MKRYALFLILLLPIELFPITDPTTYSKEDLSIFNSLPKEIYDLVVAGKFNIKYDEGEKSSGVGIKRPFDLNRLWLLNQERNLQIPLAIEVKREGRDFQIFSAVLTRIKDNKQLKESLLFTAPEPVRSMNWSTLRIEPEPQERVWFYSSILKRARQMPSISRLDPMTLSSMSLDDLFTFSGSSKNYVIQKRSETETLLPGSDDIWSMQKAVLFEVVPKSTFARFTRETLYVTDGIPILKLSFLSSGILAAITYTVYNKEYPSRTVRFATVLREKTVVAYEKATDLDSNFNFDPYAEQDLALTKDQGHMGTLQE